VYVKTDVPIAGISLDVFASGDAIRFTDATVLNPAGPAPALGRWFDAFVSNGTVAADGLSITAIEGAAFVGLPAGGMGLDPAMVDSDFGFHFATIEYEVASDFGSISEIFLKVGRNAVGGVDKPFTLALGPGDLVANTTGATGQSADAFLRFGYEIPEAPAIGLAVFGYGVFVLVGRLDQRPIRKNVY
jgi:hypothetical protein